MLQGKGHFLRGTPDRMLLLVHSPLGGLPLNHGPMLLKIPTYDLRMFYTETVFLEHVYFGVLVSCMGSFP